jgi:tryptophan halogenase
MKIVIVGGGTAGWLTALIISARHPNHNVTVIESSKLGVIGVGESTTGRFTDILTNYKFDYGCDLNEFIVETGATLKYAIHHKGWTNNIDQGYLGPIDGSFTCDNVPDFLLSWGQQQLAPADFVKISEFGYRIANNKSNFNKFNKKFIDNGHAMHVDAHLAGQYFKKISLKKANASYIDSIVKTVNLNSENGFIKSVVLDNGTSIEGDFFIDCSGFNRILMQAVAPNKWVSYQNNLPLNTGLPFLLKYKENETPESYTTAWAQKNGWMWQIPLMDRKGCGYVFCDAYTTPDKAQEEIETILGQPIDPIRTIKFDAGRQESAWVKNCLSVGLSSAFLEPLEATSIHSSVVQAHNFAVEYLKDTIDNTINEGSQKIYNHRTRTMYDDIKDFIVMHYMGGRTDSDFWKMINTGVTRTEFVDTLLSMGKSRMPSTNDFSNYPGGAGWSLYSFVMAGLGLIDKDASASELQTISDHGMLQHVAAEVYYNMQDVWNQNLKDCYSYDEFINHFRNIRGVK